MPNTFQATGSPPRPPPLRYHAPLRTRLAREKMAAGDPAVFDLPSDPKSIGPWILGECIGKGTSGRVKIAKHRLTGQLAAVKILPTEPKVGSSTSLETRRLKLERQRFGIEREITMMKLMNHPNIMRIYDVYEGEKELFLVLEYVQGGELFDLLVNRGRLSPDEALVYFKQIIYGLNYAHAFSIIHRDLKPENILVASLSPPLIKIADWGMATFAPPSLHLETSCGSPHYASPEIVNGEPYQGTATDIWSCGVILFALLVGWLPFDDKNIKVLLAKVKAGKYDIPNWIDPLAKDLLKRMLVVDPKKRITVREILSHPWLISPDAKPDFGLVSLIPHLPPSPHELAQPISSAEDIDPELLMSLTVIWGRRTRGGSESIIRELCSPPGHGTHAKAFYYLLRRYREESLRKRLTDGTTGYWGALSQEGVEPAYRSRHQAHPTHQRSRSVSSSSGPVPAMVSLHNQTNNDSSINHRLNTPTSPRPLQSARFEAYYTQHLQGLTNKHVNPPLLSPQLHHSGTGGGISNSPPAKGGNNHLGSANTMDWQIEGKKETDQPDGWMASSADYQSVLLDTPSIIRSQNPIGAVGNAVIPRNIYHPSSGGRKDTGNEKAMNRRAARSRDKENRSVSDEGWCFISSEQERQSAGLGLNSTREIGKDITRGLNVLSPSSKFKKVRARKERPPPLKILPKDSDPTVFGTVNRISPVQEAPGSGGSNSPVMSPIAGEFRGWFSNLFNWKFSAQAILYSINGMPQTRLEVGKLVESLGITVEGSGALNTDGGHGETLKCRLEQVLADPTSTINLKPVKFRIEFSTAQADSFCSARDSGYLPDLSTTAPFHPVVPKGRVPSLAGRSATTCHTPLPSPGVYLPPGYTCAIIMVHEKGSLPAFRTVWKWLRDVYCGGSPPNSSCSPPASAIPFADNHSRLASN